MTSWLQFHTAYVITWRKKKPVNQANSLSLLLLLLLLLLLQIVCLCRTTRQQWVHNWKRGNAQEPHRGTEGTEASSDRAQRNIWWICAPPDHDNPVDIILEAKGGKVPKKEPKKEPRHSASMRAAKNDDGGTVIFLLQLLVIFCGHTLGCHSPPVCAHHTGRTGHRLVSNTVASARGDASSWEPFPANNYAELLASDGASEGSRSFAWKLVFPLSDRVHAATALPQGDE